MQKINRREEIQNERSLAIRDLPGNREQIRQRSRNGVQILLSRGYSDFSENCESISSGCKRAI